MEFKEVENIPQLLDFQKDRGTRHRNYYHYTNIDSIIKIIKSGYWHLTSGYSDKLNDQQEMQKGSFERWQRTYLGCFAYGDNENMAMWGLYGLPWEEAVLVSIPQKQMLAWIQKDMTIYSAAYNGVGFEYDIINHNSLGVELVDIVYISGYRGSENNKIHYQGNSIPIHNNYAFSEISEDKRITGFLKNNAWSYEQEVRIRVELENKIKSEKIAIKMPDELINSITITAGPYFKGNIKKKIEDRILDEYKIKGKDSDFKDLVRYRSICDMCKYGRFIRKVSRL